MSAKHINSADFDAVVLKSEKPVLVDFYADWCGPCKKLAPILDDIADTHADALDIVKVDVDKSPDLAEKYSIKGMPTLLLFKDGQIIGQRSGGAPKNELTEWIRGFIPLPAKTDAPPPVLDSGAKLQDTLKNIMGMIGLDAAKRDIRQHISLARFNRLKEELGLTVKPVSRHLVFIGNPGTGKTTLAREVAKVYHALGFIKNPVVHEVSRSDLVAGFLGQTAGKTMEQIEKARGGILFIDEAYALANGATSSGDYGKESIDTLTAAMENMRDDLVVIVAGYPEEMEKFINANVGLKSRFTTYIRFDDYNTSQLNQIMDSMLRDRGYTIDNGARRLALTLLEEEKRHDDRSFGNGRAVRTLVEKAEKEMAMRLDNEGKLDIAPAKPQKMLIKKLTTIKLADIQKIATPAASQPKPPSSARRVKGH